MNTVKIGTDFEREAYKFLKKHFDKVTWMKHGSRYDFKCYKNGKPKFGETNNKPSLNSSQKNVDYLITKMSGKFKIFNKKEILEKIKIIKDSKIIKISKKTKHLLDKEKIHYRETYDDLINRILKKIRKK